MLNQQEFKVRIFKIRQSFDTIPSLSIAAFDNLSRTTLLVLFAIFASPVGLMSPNLALAQAISNMSESQEAAVLDYLKAGWTVTQAGREFKDDIDFVTGSDILESTSTTHGDQWWKVFGTLLTMAEVSEHVTDDEYGKAAATLGKFVALDILTKNKRAETLLGFSSYASLASMPIDLALKAFTRLVDRRGFDNQLKAYSLARDDFGLSHSQLVAGRDANGPGGTAYFGDNRWFYALIGTFSDGGKETRTIPAIGRIPLSVERDAAFELFRLIYDIKKNPTRHRMAQRSAIAEFQALVDEAKGQITTAPQPASAGQEVSPDATALDLSIGLVETSLEEETAASNEVFVKAMLLHRSVVPDESAESAAVLLEVRKMFDQLTVNFPDSVAAGRVKAQNLPNVDFANLPPVGWNAGKQAIARDLITTYDNDLKALHKIADAAVYALMSTAAYDDAESLATLADRGWRQVPLAQGKSTLPIIGDATASLFEKGGRSVLAFRGTSAKADWVTNIIGTITPTPFLSEQVSDAIRIAKEVANVRPDLTLTGHSLGGRLAQAGRMATGKPAIVFNSAPIGVRELAQHGLTNLVLNGDVALERYRSPQDQLSGVFPANDIEVRNIVETHIRDLLSISTTKDYLHNMGVLQAAMENVRQARDLGWLAAYVDQQDVPPSPAARSDQSVTSGSLQNGLYAVSAETCALSDADIGDRWYTLFRELDLPKFRGGYESMCTIRNVAVDGAVTVIDAACNAEGMMKDATHRWRILSSNSFIDLGAHNGAKTFFLCIEPKVAPTTTGEWGPEILTGLGAISREYSPCHDASDKRACLLEKGVSGTAAEFILTANKGSTSLSAFATGFKETGKIDVAHMEYRGASTSYYAMLVNGQPKEMVVSATNTLSAVFSDPTSQKMLRRFPNAVASYHSDIRAHRLLADGTQRFVLGEGVIDGCRACPILGSAVTYLEIGPATGGVIRRRPIGLLLGDPKDSVDMSAQVLIERPASLQVRLNMLGYYAGEMDGFAGPQTRTALMDFQAEHCLPITGQPDAATTRALMTANGFDIPCTGQRPQPGVSANTPLKSGLYVRDIAQCDLKQTPWDLLWEQITVNGPHFMLGHENPCTTTRTDIRGGVTLFRGVCAWANESRKASWRLDVRSGTEFAFLKQEKTFGGLDPALYKFCGESTQAHANMQQTAPASSSSAHSDAAVCVPTGAPLTTGGIFELLTGSTIQGRTNSGSTWSLRLEDDRPSNIGKATFTNVAGEAVAGTWFVGLTRSSTVGLCQSYNGGSSSVCHEIVKCGIGATNRFAMRKENGETASVISTGASTAAINPAQAQAVPSNTNRPTQTKPIQRTNPIESPNAAPVLAPSQQTTNLLQQINEVGSGKYPHVIRSYGTFQNAIIARYKKIASARAWTRPQPLLDRPTALNVIRGSFYGVRCYRPRQVQFEVDVAEYPRFIQSVAKVVASGADPMTQPEFQYLMGIANTHYLQKGQNGRANILRSFKGFTAALGMGNSFLYTYIDGGRGSANALETYNVDLRLNNSATLCGNADKAHRRGAIAAFSFEAKDVVSIFENGNTAEVAFSIEGKATAPELRELLNHNEPNEWGANFTSVRNGEYKEVRSKTMQRQLTAVFRKYDDGWRLWSIR